MRKSAFVSFVLLCLAAGCTRSFGPVSPPATTEAPADLATPTSLPSPPLATEEPTAEPAIVTQTPGGAPTATPAELPTATPPGAEASPQPATPTPTGAPTSTPAASPTATLPPFDPRASLGSPTFTDPMSANSFSNWAGQDGQLPDTENIRLELKDDQLFVTGKKLFFDTWWFSWPILDDFFLEMSVQTEACSGKDAYGVILRGPPRGTGDTFAYVVSFSCDGSYLVRRIDGADPYRPVDLVSWTPSSHIASGPNQSNRLGVRAVGDTLTVYANGFQIAQVMDGKYASGRYGVFVSASQSANFTYRVLEIVYWELN